jgi:hypothetical protein
MFYYFHAKKDYIYKFGGGRPTDYPASTMGEIPVFDDIFGRETFFTEYDNIIKYSSMYESWFYDSDAIDEAVEQADNAMIRDDARKELRKFVENEVTERWFMVYRKYYDPKYTWYS